MRRPSGEREPPRRCTSTITCISQLLVLILTMRPTYLSHRSQVGFCLPHFFLCAVHDKHVRLAGVAVPTGLTPMPCFGTAASRRVERYERLVSNINTNTMSMARAQVIVATFEIPESFRNRARIEADSDLDPAPHDGWWRHASQMSLLVLSSAPRFNDECFTKPNESCNERLVRV